MRSLRWGAGTAFLATLAVPFLASAVDERPDSISPIRPDCVLIEQSAAIIRQRVGQDFFANHLHFRALYLMDTRGLPIASVWQQRRDGSTSYTARPDVFYRVDWEIRFGDDRPDGIAFDMDTTGRLLSDPAGLHLPPCADQPEACAFPITRDAALEVGRKANDVKGYRDFTEFRWSDEFRRYVWVVKLWPSTTNWVDLTTPPEKGVLAIVDPNSGQVLLFGPWTK